MAETDVQKPILDLLKWFKAWVIKTITTNKGGTPDVIACVPRTPEIAASLFKKNKTLGLFVAIEVKDKGKKATPLQKAQLRKINKAGGIAFECDSIEQAKRILSENFIK